MRLIQMAAIAAILAAVGGCSKLEEAKAFEEAKKDVSLALRDPESAQFDGLEMGSLGAVCGYVNGKNAYGGYAGRESFVWLPLDTKLGLNVGQPIENWVDKANIGDTSLFLRFCFPESDENVKLDRAFKANRGKPPAASPSDVDALDLEAAAAAGAADAAAAAAADAAAAPVQ